MSKTPVGKPVQIPSLQKYEEPVGVGHQKVQQQALVRAKMKMAAMPVPKFSGNIVDYPE